jgi:hypothetical protein
MAAAGIIGVSGSIVPKITKQQQNPQSEKIIYRTLGKTGIKLPIISMGVMNTLDPEIVKQSYDMGVRHFDTARAYFNGRNEEMVGSVIKQLNIRDKVTITTKIQMPQAARGQPPLEPSAVKERFMSYFGECLQRLQMDHVDILMVHQVSSAEVVKHPGILEAFAELKKAKKIRFAGISVHNPQVVLNAMVESKSYDVALCQVNFTMAENTALFDAIKNAVNNGIGIMAMKTQGGGRLPSNLGPINQTAALKWVLRNENITTAIPGYTNFDQLKEDFSIASNLEYTPEEKKFLQDKNIKIGLGFCQQCSSCIPTCPYTVDIPTLMRVSMYAVQYSNFYQARETFNEIPEEYSLNKCKQCSVCTAKCAHYVNIKGNIDVLKTMYT